LRSVVRFHRFALSVDFHCNCDVRPGTAATAHECKHRGQFDKLYCDEDNDLVADAPSEQ
jgi:hypothetical protein